MNKGDIQKRIKLLGNPGMGMLVTDIIKVADTLLLDAEEGSDIEYGKVALKVIAELRGRYKTALRVEDIKVKQTDLEVLINDLATGKEPKWEPKEKI